MHACSAKNGWQVVFSERFYSHMRETGALESMLLSVNAPQTDAPPERSSAPTGDLGKDGDSVRSAAQHSALVRVLMHGNRHVQTLPPPPPVPGAKDEASAWQGQPMPA